MNNLTDKQMKKLIRDYIKHSFDEFSYTEGGVNVFYGRDKQEFVSINDLRDLYFEQNEQVTYELDLQ